MPSDRRIGTRIAGFADKDKIFGVKRDAGPYIGVVKNNSDPTRSGRLQVFIPDFGGVETEQSHWVTVGYASPYLGATRRPSVKTESSDVNSYTTVHHSYGMWFTPPDIDNQVLVTFVAGDTNNGYWFACIMPDLSQHAVPAIAGSKFLQEPTDAALAAALTPGNSYPCVEFNEQNDTLRQKLGNFLTIKKPVHEDQVKILLKQGLEDDPIRGVISSSSQRESPSRVFGISTPGSDGGTTDPVTGSVPYRTGGHTFVMDDGSTEGIDKLIRLRSAGGHQILMNDTEDILYIGNSTGSVWMEFTGDGKINMFSESDFTLRSQGSINLHSDKSINMFAHDDIQMFAGTKIQQQSAEIGIKAKTDLKIYGGKIGIVSGGSLNLAAATDGSFGSGTNLVFSSGMIYLNTQAAPSVTPPNDINVTTFKDTVPTVLSSTISKFKPTGSVSSTLPTPPTTHEPWTRSVEPSPVSTAPISSIITPQIGPQSSIGQGVKNPATVANLNSQPPNSVGIGSLTAAQVTALKTQIAKNESGGTADSYSAINSLGYIGKYQFGALALITHGYVSPGTSNQRLSTDPTVWSLSKDGITSVNSYFSAHDIQEKIMDLNLALNYKSLVAKGTITTDSTPEDIAGKLAVAHLLGAGGCHSWCNDGSGADANGTTGQDYYNVGRYSIVVLANSINNIL